MKTVTQVAAQTGVSVRTLHHYDAIGLLKPTKVTDSGYRLYDDDALEKLFLILIYRELGFPLKDIQAVLDAPDYDRNRILEKQVALLEQRKTHIQNLIHFARGLKLTGVRYLEFNSFNIKNLDDYCAQAETLYGKTDAWKEAQEKGKNRTKAEALALGDRMMALFAELGSLRGQSPDSEEVQRWVKRLRDFISEYYYTCTKQVLSGLGDLYAGGGSLTENIDSAGGKGTGEFAREAIRVYCGNV